MGEAWVALLIKFPPYNFFGLSLSLALSLSPLFDSNIQNPQPSNTLKVRFKTKHHHRAIIIIE